MGKRPLGAGGSEPFAGTGTGAKGRGSPGSPAGSRGAASGLSPRWFPVQGCPAVPCTGTRHTPALNHTVFLRVIFDLAKRQSPESRDSNNTSLRQTNFCSQLYGFIVYGTNKLGELAGWGGGEEKKKTEKKPEKNQKARLK